MQEQLALLLAFIAGYTDAVGLIKWQTYVSFMSGNTTQLGTGIYNWAGGVVQATVTVIGSFLVGIYAGTCLSLFKNYGNRAFACYIVAAILIVYSILGYYYEISRTGSLGIIGFSMGLMNTIIISVGKLHVNTDFVTGTLNSLARNAALFTMSSDPDAKAVYKSNAIHLLLLWLGFLSGAALAPFSLNILGSWLLLFPALLLMIAAFTILISNFKN